MFTFLQIHNKISILLPWDTGEYFSASDIVLGPVYLVFLLLFAYFYRNLFVKDPALRVYFIPGLLLKLFGSIMVGLVYAFYYTGGDTSSYFYDSSILYQTFLESPVTFFKIIFMPASHYDPQVYDYVVQMRFENDPHAFIISKITGLIALLSFRTYTVTSMLFAFFSYFGVWALFKTFTKVYPQLTKQFAISVLFIPSVVFWGSGILKDSVTFSCIGWMTFAVYNIFIERRRVLSNIVLLIFITWLIASIKPYILISIAPGILFWIFLNYKNKIQSNFLRVVSGPFVLIIILTSIYLITQVLGSEFSKYSLQNFSNTAEVYQFSNAVNVGGDQASVYDIGLSNYDGSPLSFIRIFFPAVNVTLFRPYLWEARSPIILLAALESLFLLGFTIRIMIRVGLGGFFRSIFKNPFVIYCMSFSLFFAFAVGFSASNFGALVRYKIPCMPFYLAALFIMNYETKISKEIKKNPKRSFIQDPVQIQSV